MRFFYITNDIIEYAEKPVDLIFKKEGDSYKFKENFKNDFYAIKFKDDKDDIVFVRKERFDDNVKKYEAFLSGMKENIEEINATYPHHKEYDGGMCAINLTGNEITVDDEIEIDKEY